MRVASLSTPPTWAVPGVGFAILFAATAVVQQAGLRGRASALLIVLLATAYASLSGPADAVILGSLTWAFTTGFLVNDFGRLTFGAADLAFLGFSVAVSLAGCSLGAVHRRRTNARRYSGAPAPPGS